jgi:hypothetical protein
MHPSRHLLFDRPKDLATGRQLASISAAARLVPANSSIKLFEKARQMANFFGKRNISYNTPKEE